MNWLHLSEVFAWIIENWRLIKMVIVIAITVRAMTETTFIIIASSITMAVVVMEG